jgi:hypothetical protein
MIIKSSRLYAKAEARNNAWLDITANLGRGLGFEVTPQHKTSMLQ